MNKRFFFSLLFTLFIVTYGWSQTQIIAHRGFWKTDGSAQNSIAALLKADSIGVYGSELDIWLSSDGIAVVNHDADVSLDGKKLIIEDTPLATLKKVKLSNGESLPTLEEYLNAFAKCKHTKLIVEFKSHREHTRENELVEKTVKMVRDKGLQDKVEYISFSLNTVLKTRELEPNMPVYYLNGNLSPRELTAIKMTGMDYHYSLLFQKPEWVKQAHDLGLKVNVWTVNKPEDIQQIIDLGVDFISTDEPLLTRELLNKQ